jgi:hypothetical protein
MINANPLLQSDTLVRLVQRANFVGWVFGIDYSTAKIMVNDLWKANALGVPHNSFLVATTFNPDEFASTRIEDREVILLRVVGSAQLPHDADMIRTRIDHLKDQTGIFAADGAREFDPITQNEMQFGGLECRILGTFYSRDGDLWLGSDLESFATAARLNVYRPRGSALQTIVNHVDPIRRRAARLEAEQLGLGTSIQPFRIGTVRYTSSDRLHRRDEAELVPVSVQPSDFLARRTAVLGMTRTGKSNMVKQMVSVVKRVASEGDLAIGQIIYDINGEYANPNQQDRGAIADVFPDETVRYRMLRTEGFEDLRNNFYEQMNEGFSIIRREIEAAGNADTHYVSTFLNMPLDEPDREEVGEHQRWQRKVAAFKVLLNRAGFEPPSGLRVFFSANQAVRSAVAAQAGESFADPKQGLTLYEAERWFMALREANRVNSLGSSTSGKPWVDDSLQNLLDMIVQKASSNNSFISGFRLLANAVKYHSPRRNREVAAEIYEHLVSGKIVILDLSVGDATIREKVSKQIAAHLFEQSMKAFIAGTQPPNIVVYIEEAHNLIGKDLDLTEMWPRLAKEGAKYCIGLVYATQEVSSVHPNILANTENWFVTHLNNEREIRELARFYDFDDFSESLMRAQDVGFARVKTLSGPFVIPVQIDKFDPALAAGSLSTTGMDSAT